MKVRIVMEAEVDDLPPFRETKGPEYGAARQNVFDVVRGMELEIYHSRFLNAASKGNETIKVAAEKAMDQKLKLAERLIGDMTIEFDKETT